MECQHKRGTNIPNIYFPKHPRLKILIKLNYIKDLHSSEFLVQVQAKWSTINKINNIVQIFSLAVKCFPSVVNHKERCQRDKTLFCLRGKAKNKAMSGNNKCVHSQPTAKLKKYIYHHHHHFDDHDFDDYNNKNMIQQSNTIECSYLKLQFILGIIKIILIIIIVSDIRYCIPHHTKHQMSKIHILVSQTER